MQATQTSQFQSMSQLFRYWQMISKKTFLNMIGEMDASPKDLRDRDKLSQSSPQITVRSTAYSANSEKKGMIIAIDDFRHRIFITCKGA